MSNLASVFGGALDITNIEPQDDFDVLPPGKYPVQIDKAEVKRTKAENGHYLKVTMTILDGPGKNRKLWNNINIDNPSQQCVDIGRRQLSALGRAIGIQVVSSEDQFLGKMCIAHVKVKDNQNEIRTYSSLAPADALQQAATPSPAATIAEPKAEQPSAVKSPPWIK